VSGDDIEPLEMLADSAAALLVERAQSGVKLRAGYAVLEGPTAKSRSFV
jgi:hypothetical protein